MSRAVLDTKVVGSLQMELWESPGPRYHMICRILDYPIAIVMSYLGPDLERASLRYLREVKYQLIHGDDE